MKLGKIFNVVAALSLVLGVAVFGAPSGKKSSVSSHREAPLISNDPQADNTDLYVFVSPDKPDTVTIISSWIPAEEPVAGPNYYKWADDASYYIYVDNVGDAKPHIWYKFELQDHRRQRQHVPVQHRPHRQPRCDPPARACSEGGPCRRAPNRGGSPPPQRRAPVRRAAALAEQALEDDARVRLGRKRRRRRRPREIVLIDARVAVVALARPSGADPSTAPATAAASAGRSAAPRSDRPSCPR